MELCTKENNARAPQTLPLRRGDPRIQIGPLEPGTLSVDSLYTHSTIDMSAPIVNNMMIKLLASKGKDVKIFLLSS